MKNLEQDKVEQLLRIIQDKPGQRIVHFSNGSHILSKKLSEWCKKHHSDYYLYCTKDVFYDKSVTKYTDQPHMHIMKFNLQRPSFMMQDITYDHLIATVDLTQEDKAVFLEKCHPIIHTGGNVMLFIPNSTGAQREGWMDILAAQYYVSTHIIDALFEEYDVIVSKPMHERSDR